MERDDPGAALLDALRRDYREGFAPPADAAGRVLRAVTRQAAPISARDERPRGATLVWIAVPVLAAAVLSFVWCSPTGVLRVAADDGGDAAIYQGETNAGADAAARRDRTAQRRADASGPAVREESVVSKTAAAPPADAGRVVAIDSIGDAEIDAPGGAAIVRRPVRGGLDRSPADAAIQDTGVDPVPPNDVPKVDVPPTDAGPRIEGLVVALQQVERDLRGDRPEHALATLTRLREALEAAGLAEEHDALRLLARCSQRPAAAHQGLRARFTAAFPGSLYADRIAKTCDAAAAASSEPSPR